MCRVLPFFVWLIAATATAGEAPQLRRFSSFDLDRAFEADGSRGPFQCGGGPILQGSDQLWIDGQEADRDADYRVDYASGTVTFYRPPQRGATVRFRAKRIPDVLERRVYSRRAKDDVNERIVAPALLRSRTPGRPIRGGPAETRLSIGGVKRLQVEVGSTQTVTQSLRLEMTGELSGGVELQALLTDRHLPLQAGGQTRGLDELDRVLFRVTSASMSAGVGDLEVDFDGPSFGRYRRQLQGIQVSGEREGYRFEGFGAVARGRRISRRIPALHGFQGPYRVGVSSLVLAAGSERVYLDGRRLRRGEGQDYVIDYDRGQITFTASQPISGESQITVDAQSLDPNDRGRLLGFRGRRSWGGEGRIGTTFLREAGAVDAGGSRQLLAVDAATSVQGVRVSGEVGLSGKGSDAEATNGSAIQLGIETGARQAGRGELSLSASYRDIGRGFEALDRVTRVNEEGRWGWRPESELLTGKIVEAGGHFTDRSGLGLSIGYGQRTGSVTSRRITGSARLDRGDIARGEATIERLTRSGGSLVVHGLDVSRPTGWLRPSITLRDETGTGNSVRASSLFYATVSSDAGLPEGIRRRDGRLEVEVGSRRRSWTSTISVSRVSQLVEAWSDSTTTVAHHHRAVLGTRGLNMTAEVGRTWREEASRGTTTSDLGRVRLNLTPANGAVSQQLTYRVATTGVRPLDTRYVFVGDGRGSFLWEDVDGDGAQDAEEFIYEAGGNYEIAFPGASDAFPMTRVREATVGARTTIDPSRRWRDATGVARLATAVAYEGAIESHRQMTGDGGLAPWSLGSFRADDSVWAARRELRSTLHLFRRSRVASFRLDDRREHRMDRALSEEGRSERHGQRLEGRFRFGRRFDLEARAEGERRLREGDGPFAHAIRSRTLHVRGLLRLTSGWETGASITVGRDLEARREIEADRITLGPEFRKPLAGRGRLTGRAGWTRVGVNRDVPLFLGLADGNRRGDNVDWRLGFDYRLSSYLTAFASYDGRLRPERPLLHFGRMEMRASF